MTNDPYSGVPQSKWLGVTNRLVAAHPLELTQIHDAAIAAWTTLWQTTVGKGALALRISDLRVPATVVGYFFEVLLARELESRDPRWRGSQSKDEKDVVCLDAPQFSIEIKTSGQSGFKVYGNRSYGQKAASDFVAKKEKSGYYITVNFVGHCLTLIRFGWIDAADWAPQAAQTGQMAGLKQAVYDYKLLPVPGAYRQQTPISLLTGVGPATEKQFAALGIHTIAELFSFEGELPRKLSTIVKNNQSFLEDCTDVSP
jgi:hypothetical protein